MSEELDRVFEDYFELFPWFSLPLSVRGFDLGCGSGRWDAQVAPRVGRLFCIDPSASALKVAKENLGHLSNCAFVQAGVDELPMPDARQWTSDTRSGCSTTCRIQSAGLQIVSAS